MNYNPANMSSSPEHSYSSSDVKWDSLKYAKSNFTENYNTPTSPAEDQLSILSKSPLQQDKLTKATLSNNPEVYDQPQVNIYPEERKHFSQLLLNDNFNNTYLRRSIDHISAPIDTHTPEEIFWPMSNNKHFRRILAYATGVGVKNYQYVNPRNIQEFLERYPSPMDYDEPSNIFLQDIKEHNSSDRYQKYLGDMYKFKHLIYGEQQEYWDQAKLMRQEALAASTENQDAAQAPTAQLSRETLPTSPESILSRAVIDGDSYTVNGYDYTLTPEALQQANLAPHHEVVIDNRPIYLSNTFDAGNYRAAIAYVESSDGKVHARSYYQSKSSGAWRYLPDYVSNDGSGSPWFGKAYSEESLTLPFELQQSLNYISAQGPTDTSNIDPEFLFFGTAKKYPSKGDYIRLRRDGLLRGDFYQEVAPVPQYDFGRLSPDKHPPEYINIDGTNAPDFRTSLGSTKINSSLYNNATVEFYPSFNKNLYYSFCAVDHPTRAWVGGIETTSPVTSTGCRSNWVSAGDISTPLYEYKSQADGYGDYRDSKGPYQSMWQNYLSKVPLIRRYLYETGKY